MSNAIILHFPEEIQIEILSRLPPKSLARFNCVSKHWNDTLTIQAFFVSHSRSFDKHSKLAFVGQRHNISGYNFIVSFELNDDNYINPNTVHHHFADAEQTIVLSSEKIIRGEKIYFGEFLPSTINPSMSNICNDLICLFDPSSTSVVLLNLKTRDFIHLPAITNPMYDFRLWCALGFDPVNKVFKVLSIIYRVDSCEGCATKAAILTVGSKYWKTIEYECLPSSLTKKKPELNTTNNSLYLDGVIYWAHDVRTRRGKCVLTFVEFYLNREAFRDYEIVVTIDGDTTFGYYLTSLKGRPTLFLLNRERNEIQQLTLFKNKNLNAAWSRRILASDDFPSLLYLCFYGKFRAGSSILLDPVISMSINGDFVKPREQDLYFFYNPENLAVE
ncbi:putative F-box protein At3g52320 [Silene latifolia]|uniref:putative F-box protein At3g52320 n=1 Tax=Silene latifolia TaxID=37657 RepID=UPI003D76E5E4